MTGAGDAIRRGFEPHDRLTCIADAMTKTMDAHPATRDGDRAVVMLSDDDWGGIVLHGYRNDVEALVDLFIHVQAIFRANGKDLELISIPDDPSRLDR